MVNYFQDQEILNPTFAVKGLKRAFDGIRAVSFHHKAHVSTDGYRPSAAVASAVASSIYPV